MRRERILVTGSSGHLGEALVRVLQSEGLGLDVVPSPHTTGVGSISERRVVRDCLQGVGAVLHAAALHKPHVSSHARTVRSKRYHSATVRPYTLK